MIQKVRLHYFKSRYAGTQYQYLLISNIAPIALKLGVRIDDNMGITNLVTLRLQMTLYTYAVPISGDL